MLRTREQVRVLGPGDRDRFVALAEQDPVVNVFADYRARLTNLDERWLGGQVWGRFDGDDKEQICTYSRASGFGHTIYGKLGKTKLMCCFVIGPYVNL